jgi:hypothetical protein
MKDYVFFNEWDPRVGESWAWDGNSESRKRLHFIKLDESPYNRILPTWGTEFVVVEIPEVNNDSIWGKVKVASFGQKMNLFWLKGHTDEELGLYEKDYIYTSVKFK